MKLENILAVATKVATANGGSDLMQVIITSVKGDKKLSLCCYDGKALQIQQMLTADEDMPEGTYILKASAFVSVLKALAEAGSETISLVPGDGKVTIRDGSGEVMLQTAPKIVTLSKSQIGKVTVGEAAIKTKAFADAIRKTAASVSKAPEKLAGMCFVPDGEKRFIIYATDGYRGVRIPIDAEITVHGEHKPEELTFFVMPALLKAAAVMKGENLKLVIGGSYVLIMDGENTVFTVAKHEGAFPVDMLRKIFLNKGELRADGEQADRPFVAEIKAGKGQFIPAIDMVNLMSSAEVKTAVFEFIREGNDMSFSVKEKDGKVNRKMAGLSGLGEQVVNTSLSFSTQFAKEMLAAVDEDTVTLRIFANQMLVYGAGTEPLAFLLPRK